MTKGQKIAIKEYPAPRLDGGDEEVLRKEQKALDTKRACFANGYERGWNDLMVLVKDFFMFHTNIPCEVETDADGQPLAGSYIDYAMKRAEAAEEMFAQFRERAEAMSVEDILMRRKEKS